MPEPINFERVSSMYNAVILHVLESGHSGIIPCDDPNKRQLGLTCHGCSLEYQVMWTAPYPGPGHYHFWPRDLRNPQNLSSRNEYLRERVQEARNAYDKNRLERFRPQRPPRTVWDRLVSND